MTDSLGRRPRRPWTAHDDDLLRKFHAEGKSDSTIAYILSRTKVAIWRRRQKLKLGPVGRRGAPTGWTMSPEAVAKCAEATRQRWKDPAYRERMILEARKGLAKRWSESFKRPPQGTPEHKTYRKLCKYLGPAQARQEMGLA